MTSARYQDYSARERDSLPGTASSEIPAAITGSPDSVREQLATLAAELPVDPVIVRAQWPGMDIEAVEEYLAVLGKEIVQPLADVPVRDATLPVTP
jgi:alkanesulfonate monooxygenase SsuD/methylene tetrahydromethanopterin reductase-like flavin-dependent oxidoreductase (luciferase family)